MRNPPAIREVRSFRCRSSDAGSGTLAYIHLTDDARWTVGDCSKSKKLKKMKKPKPPKFECGKCGVVAEEKKHVCKPTKVKAKKKKDAKQ
jgi:hypothetical protein